MAAPERTISSTFEATDRSGGSQGAVSHEAEAFFEVVSGSFPG